MKHQNKVALVTGSARGIGLACAKRLKDDGATLVLSDVLDAVGQAAAKELGAHYFHCDVSKPEEVARLVSETVKLHGAIDILINNAGVSAGGEFTDISLEDFDRVISINMRGAFIVAQAVAREMVKQVKAGRAPGVIVNMSSVNAVLAISSQVPYSMSKGAINQMTKVAALSLAPHGIRVNAIGPGSIMTDMLSSVNSNEEARRRVMSRTPIGRVGDPSEVASIASFLASEDASYITGQTIYCDGGRLPLNYTVAVKD